MTPFAPATVKPTPEHRTPPPTMHLHTSRTRHWGPIILENYDTPFRALGKARCFVYGGFVVALETREARLDPGDGAGRKTVA